MNSGVPAPPDSRADDSAVKSSKGQKVLIVDDDFEIIESVRYASRAPVTKS